MKHRLLVSLWVVAAAVLPGCVKSDDDATSKIDLSASPEFVNRIIPGRRPLGLVSVGSGGDVSLIGTASLPSATVTFVPTEVPAGGVAEVWVDLPDATVDTPFTVDVLDKDGRSSTVTFDATLIAGVDDLADTAEEIVAVFLDRIGDDITGLPATVSDLPPGTPVAGLLVVSHYAWFTDDYEIGLAWHIMVAPNDFAEIYLRPRDSLVPTVAYRINSWSTALAGGEYEFFEIDPPAEVTR